MQKDIAAPQPVYIAINGNFDIDTSIHVYTNIRLPKCEYRYFVHIGVAVI